MYTLHSQFLKTPLFKITPLSQTTPIKPSLLSQPHLPRSSTPILSPIRSRGDGGQGGSENGPPPDMVEIRFRRGSRRRKREQEGNYGNEQLNTTKPTQPLKSWEEMTFQEKALELYVGEKGLLFWLNKFAYASIYIIIGGWILFRFVGPALNLYQLDAPPLPPTAIFKS